MINKFLYKKQKIHNCTIDFLSFLFSIQFDDYISAKKQMFL